MKLEPAQEATMRGESGDALAKAMQTLVAYGEAFGAQRLTRIKSGHLAGTFSTPAFTGYNAILDQMIAEGVKVKVPTTTNPRPGRTLSVLNRLLFGQQERFEEKLRKLGATPNYSCVCYESANVPERGDVVAWAESSAVQFANSVLGARCNRNSILIDLCSAVTGVTPEFGYLLDENRRGHVLVKLEIKRMDASALGFVIGRKVLDKVPVIEHYDFTWTELKNMGGAMAASGAVALFHIEGVTPEAPDLGTAFSGEPEATITVAQRDLDALRTDDPENTDLVVFGCPQMTFAEACELAEHLPEKKVRKPTLLCLIPEAKERFETTDLFRKVRGAGVRVADCCPVAALTPRLRRRRPLSPSAKCLCYLDGTVYGTTDDCLRVCGGGS